MKHQQGANFSAYFSAEEVKTIEEYAEKKGISRSVILKVAVKEYLERKGKDEIEEIKNDNRRKKQNQR